MQKRNGGVSTKKSHDRRQAHDALVDNIILTLSRMGIMAWQHKTGVATIKGRIVKYGLIGSSDIVAIMRNGMFWGIEVKTGSAKQEPQQKLFEMAVKRRNAHYTVARSIDDVINYYISIGNP